MSTESDHVEGRSLPEFLIGARERLHSNAALNIKDIDALEATLADIDACEVTDVVGEIYASLVGLASKVYRAVLGESFDPPLLRTVITSRESRDFYVRGEVPASRGTVMLSMWESGFDMLSLALVPYILAHEIVCHIGARHTGIWEEVPDPDVRHYFSDGFMDRAAWLLLMQWLHEGTVPELTPVGHLSEAETPYAAKRPDAFKAGRAAWSNCGATIATRLRDDGDDGRRRAALGAEADEAIIRAALRINTVGCDVRGKDMFVHRARIPDDAVTSTFADVALDDAAPGDLLEHTL